MNTGARWVEALSPAKSKALVFLGYTKGIGSKDGSQIYCGY